MLVALFSLLAPLIALAQTVVYIPDILIIPFDSLNISDAVNATCGTRCDDVCLLVANGTVLTSAPEEGSCVCDCDNLCPMGTLCDLAGYVEDPCNATVSYDHYACMDAGEDCIDGVLHGSVECAVAPTFTVSASLTVFAAALVAAVAH
jgi:hypothetical protein